MSDADRVIAMRPEWQKGYFRKASIYELQEQYVEALQWYKKSADCNGENRDVEFKIRNLTRLVKDRTKGQSVENGSDRTR